MASASAAATPSHTDDTNIITSFQLQNSIDRRAHAEILSGLDGEKGSVTIPTNVVAAVLVSILKGLACPSPYLVPNSSQLDNEIVELPRGGGLHGLALNFVQYQSIFTLEESNASSASATPQLRWTLVQVAQYLIALLKKWGARKNPTSTLAIMYRFFLEYQTPSSEIANEYDSFSENVESFNKLLSQTLDDICLNILQCLEDFSDFEYLWSSTLHGSGTDTPLFSSSVVSPIPSDLQSMEQRETAPKMQEVKTSYRNKIQECRKRRCTSFGGVDGDVSYSFESVKHVAKELAWTLLQSANQSESTSHTGTERKHRILNAAACVDLVTAALMAPIISAPISKKRRFESGDIDPRRSAGDEAAAVLSKILTTRVNDAHDSSFDTELRGRLKRSLSKATADLTLSLTFDSSPVHHKDIVGNAQKIALAMLKLLNENYESLPKKSSPASQLLSYISSHKLREKSMSILKSNYHSTISERVSASISFTRDFYAKDQVAFKLGWLISKIQRDVFIDTMHDFFHLCLSERKLLAPFESSPSHKAQIMEDVFKARVLIYRDRSKEVRPVRHALQLSRVRNPPATEAALKDLDEWKTSILDFVSTASSIKPSHWLIAQLASTRSFMYDGKDAKNRTDDVWKEIISPVLKYFMTIVAQDPDVSHVSDSGEYVLRHNDTMPGAVLQLYYFALEAILRASPSDHTLLSQNKQRFHSSLFSLCSFCLQTAKNPNGHSFVIEDIGDCPVAFYKLVGLLIDDKKSGIESVEMSRALALPAYLTHVLRRLQEMILSMVWMKNNNDLECNMESSFLGMVIRLRENPDTWRRTCPIAANDEKNRTQGISREQMLVSHLLRNLDVVTSRRVSELCMLLPLQSPPLPLEEQCMEIFRMLLHYRTDLFFDRHPDQLMLCCLYATVRRNITFQNIADAYMQMNENIVGSEISYEILHRIKNCSEHGTQYGDIISLFNDIFLPGAMKSIKLARQQASK